MSNTDAQRLADICEDIAHEAPAWLSPVTVADTRWLLAKLDQANARLALAERVAEAGKARRDRQREANANIVTDTYKAPDAYEVAYRLVVESEKVYHAALDAWEAGKDVEANVTTKPPITAPRPPLRCPRCGRSSDGWERVWGYVWRCLSCGWHWEP